jgi:transposase-like protein
MKMSISQLAADVSKTKSMTPGGKLRYPEAIKKAAVRLFKQQTDMTPKEFAGQIGISDSALVQWVTLDKSSRNPAKESFIPVAEAESPRESKTSGLTVSTHIGCGFIVIYVPGSRADLVAAVVRELGAI